MFIALFYVPAWLKCNIGMDAPINDLTFLHDMLRYKNEDGSVVEWLKHRADDQHGLGLKPTCAILLCPWERHFTALSPAWWSWQAVLNYSISTKLLAESNMLASPEAGRGNCLPYVYRLRRFPASQENKYRDKIKK